MATIIERKSHGRISIEAHNCTPCVWLDEDDDEQFCCLLVEEEFSRGQDNRRVKIFLTIDELDGLCGQIQHALQEARNEETLTGPE